MADRGTMGDGCFDNPEPGEKTLEPGWLSNSVTAFCGASPGTVTRRASVTADVFGELYVAEFDVVPGETVTLPPPGPDETGVWRKLEEADYGIPNPEEIDGPSIAMAQLAIAGESPADTARRIRTEISELRIALEDERRERDALEWLALNGYPVGRGVDGRVMAVYREEDVEPDWKASWVEAAKDCGWKGT